MRPFFAHHYTAQGPRATNQDAVDADDQLGFAVVADGMGGSAGGDRASRITVSVISSSLRRRAAFFRHGGALGDACREAILEANRRVMEAAEANESLRGMGSTVAMICLSGHRLCSANVGDSRVYLLRAGRLIQLSHDHSRVQERVDAGLITPEEARFQPDRNVITRVIGLCPEVSPHLVEGELQCHDRFILTSDGVHGVLEEHEMLRILSSPAGTDPAEALVRLALERGSRDNATAAVFGAAGPAEGKQGGRLASEGIARLVRLFRKE